MDMTLSSKLLLRVLCQYKVSHVRNIKTLPPAFQSWITFQKLSKSLANKRQYTKKAKVVAAAAKAGTSVKPRQDLDDELLDDGDETSIQSPRSKDLRTSFNTERGRKGSNRNVHKKKPNMLHVSESDIEPFETTVTLFHKPSQHIYDINLAKKGSQNFSIHFKNNDQVLNVTVAQAYEATVTEVKEEDKATEDASMKSIEEMMWKPSQLEMDKLIANYLKLAKVRLTGLVVITQMAGYAMAPGVFDPLTFLLCSIGTGLTSASANSMNQFFEIPYDSQMNRTKNRVLVRGHLSPLHAVGFAGVSATVGLGILGFGVNPLTAGLGLFNLGLYTLAYTPMKRLSVANTWVGAFVGAIPPMMGWAACTGGLEPGAWLLGAILYAWQFPHFNALSWNLRPDYSRAGYRMMSVVNPALCKRVALRYSVGMIGLCTLAPVLDVTTWTFAIDSLPLNVYMSYLGWQFYKQGDSKTSRKLFRFTLIHIPALMILMLISKKSYKDKTTPKAVIEEPIPS